MARNILSETGRIVGVEIEGVGAFCQCGRRLDSTLDCVGCDEYLEVCKCSVVAEEVKLEELERL